MKVAPQSADSRHFGLEQGRGAGQPFPPSTSTNVIPACVQRRASRVDAPFALVSREALRYPRSVAIASARANIALVKYWGKRDAERNIPAAGSLSVTLEALETRTEVQLIDGPQDSLRLDGSEAPPRETARVSAFIDRVRGLSGREERARVVSFNRFPTASGLASSASAFAALGLAAARAYGLSLSPRALSVLARQGSGSAARSVFGGLVRMHSGEREDGTDAFAEPLDGSRLELVAAIAVTSAQAKAVGSTDGMERTRTTSPYHRAWLQQVDIDLDACVRALRGGDFDALAETVEGSCLAMHANALAARPGLLYFAAPTLYAIERVRALRREGVPVCFTVDAGPHVVALTLRPHLDRVVTELADHPDIAEVLTSGPGDGVREEADLG